ncbi:MAG TPA: DUF2459 domain-containing protein, partial [Bacteroidales bacterium]|nr:DUF2459 domain-containing protein [Bacteroidales bacterium]
YKIYVVKYDWHTGVIFERMDAVKFFPALQDDYKDFKFIEIGWGDKDFYMAEKETFWITFKAGMFPTKSALHVTALMNNPEIHYRGIEMVIIDLSEDDFKNLIQYFNKSFALDEYNKNIKLKNGLKENSLFYLSNEKYHIFKTCNAWIARGLKRADVQIHPFFALTSKNVMKQLKRVNEDEHQD